MASMFDWKLDIIIKFVSGCKVQKRKTWKEDNPSLTEINLLFSLFGSREMRLKSVTFWCAISTFLWSSGISFMLDFIPSHPISRTKKQESLSRKPHMLPKYHQQHASDQVYWLGSYYDRIVIIRQVCIQTST